MLIRIYATESMAYRTAFLLDMALEGIDPRNPMQESKQVKPSENTPGVFYQQSFRHGNARFRGG